MSQPVATTGSRSALLEYLSLFTVIWHPSLLRSPVRPCPPRARSDGRFSALVSPVASHNFAA